jgi:nucleolar complex protein 2
MGVFSDGDFCVLQDAFKQVYNWQYVHCIDFWSIVLAKTCSVESKIARGGEESALQPLIYPLTQVALGAVKCVSPT